MFVSLEKIGEDGSPAVLPEMAGDVDVDVAVFDADVFEVVGVVVEEGCVVDVLAVVFTAVLDVDVVFEVGCVDDDVGKVVFDEVEFDVELEDCVGWVVFVVVLTVNGDVIVVEFVDVFVVGWTVVVFTVEDVEDEEVGWFVELAVVFIVEDWVVEVFVVLLVEKDPEIAIGCTVEVVLLEELEFVCTSITAGPKLKSVFELGLLDVLLTVLLLLFVAAVLVLLTVVVVVVLLLFILLVLFVVFILDILVAGIVTLPLLLTFTVFVLLVKVTISGTTRSVLLTKGDTVTGSVVITCVVGFVVLLVLLLLFVEFVVELVDDDVVEFMTVVYIVTV